MNSVRLQSLGHRLKWLGTAIFAATALASLPILWDGGLTSRATTVAFVVAILVLVTSEVLRTFVRSDQLQDTIKLLISMSGRTAGNAGQRDVIRREGENSAAVPTNISLYSADGTLSYSWDGTNADKEIDTGANSAAVPTTIFSYSIDGTLSQTLDTTNEEIGTAMPAPLVTLFTDLDEPNFRSQSNERAWVVASDVENLHSNNPDEYSYADPPVGKASVREAVSISSGPAYDLVITDQGDRLSKVMVVLLEAKILTLAQITHGLEALPFAIPLLPPEKAKELGEKLKQAGATVEVRVVQSTR